MLSQLSHVPRGGHLGRWDKWDTWDSGTETLLKEE